MIADDPAGGGAASEADILLQFSAESAADPLQLFGPKEDDRSSVGRDGAGRIERAERHIERALIEITTLKSDLATLVSAVEDMKRRMSRPADRQAAVIARMPSRRLARGRTIAAIILLITAGVAAWGLSVATDDLPKPPAIEYESSGAAVNPVSR